MESNQTDYFKRNFTLGVANGLLVNFGMAFMDPFTVLPVFISRLGGSSVLIGFVSALYGAGWFFPQVFVSRIAETRSRLLGIYRQAALVRILTWAGVVLTFFVVDPSKPVLFLTLFVGCLLLTNIGAGVAAIPFLEITSKTIPVTSRGLYFGWRRFSGGVLGVFAGILVGLILNEETAGGGITAGFNKFLTDTLGPLGLFGHEFPVNYGILFLLGGLLVSIGLVLFCFVGEVPTVTDGRKPSRLLEHLIAGLNLIRRDENYRLFYLVRICWQFTAMAFPFYSTYAVFEMGFSESAVGIFVALWMGAGVVSNYLWGKILDRQGNKLVLIITAGFSVIPPIILLIWNHLEAAGRAALPGWAVFTLIASTFFINGFIRSGRFISNITYLLEIAPVDKRPLYVGFMNSFTFPLMLSPMVGGLILNWFGITVLFSASLCFAVANFLLSIRLQEPRQ